MAKKGNAGSARTRGTDLITITPKGLQLLRRHRLGQRVDLSGLFGDHSLDYTVRPIAARRRAA